MLVTFHENQTPLFGFSIPYASKDFYSPSKLANIVSPLSGLVLYRGSFEEILLSKPGDSYFRTVGVTRIGRVTGKISASLKFRYVAGIFLFAVEDVSRKGVKRSFVRLAPEEDVKMSICKSNEPNLRQSDF